MCSGFHESKNAPREFAGAVFMMRVTEKSWMLVRQPLMSALVSLSHLMRYQQFRETAPRPERCHDAPPKRSSSAYGWGRPRHRLTNRMAGPLPDASAPWNVARRRPICRRRICRRPIGRRPICSADNRSTIGAERVQHATARVVGPRQGPQALTDRAIGAGEAAGFAT